MAWYGIRCFSIGRRKVLLADEGDQTNGSAGARSLLVVGLRHRRGRGHHPVRGGRLHRDLRHRVRRRRHRLRDRPAGRAAVAPGRTARRLVAAHRRLGRVPGRRVAAPLGGRPAGRDRTGGRRVHRPRLPVRRVVAGRPVAGARRRGPARRGGRPHRLPRRRARGDPAARPSSRLGRRPARRGLHPRRDLPVLRRARGAPAGEPGLHHRGAPAGLPAADGRAGAGPRRRPAVRGGRGRRRALPVRHDGPAVPARVHRHRRQCAAPVRRGARPRGAGAGAGVVLAAADGDPPRARHPVRAHPARR